MTSRILLILAQTLKKPASNLPNSAHFMKPRKSASVSNNQAAYSAARDAVATKFMEFRLAQPIIEQLTVQLNEIVDRIRQNERHIMKLCVQKGSMARQDFIDSFPQNETDLEWLNRYCDYQAWRPYPFADLLAKDS